MKTSSYLQLLQSTISATWRRFISVGLLALCFASPLMAGVVAEYKFDGNTNDTSGNGNHLTLVGNAALGSGVVGGGLVLDGSGDWAQVNIPNYALPNFTLECWINVPSYTSNVHYLSLYQNQYLVLGDYSSGNLDTWADGLSPVMISAPFAGVTTNAWHHIAFTYDGTNQRLYIDGVLKTTTATTGVLTQNPATFNQGLTIGARYSRSGNQAVAGSIDVVRIHNTALTAPQLGFFVDPSAPEIAVFDGLVTDPQLTDNTGTQDFGSVNTGSSSAAQTFTIRNDGTADLTGIAVTKAVTGNPGDFTVNTAGMLTTLVPNATTTFTVTFSPTAAAARTAVVEIASNDADENPFEINVAGTGRQQKVVLGGNSADAFQQALEDLNIPYINRIGNSAIDPALDGLGAGDIIIYGFNGTLGPFFDYTSFLNSGGHLLVAGGSNYDPYRTWVSLYFNLTDTSGGWHTDGPWTRTAVIPQSAGLPANYTFQNNLATFHMLGIAPTVNTTTYGQNGEGVSVAGIRSYANGGTFHYMAMLVSQSSFLTSTDYTTFTRPLIQGALGVSAPTTVPEIAVVNSLSTNIPDGGSQAFGTTDVAETLTQTFTVNNTGSGALNLGAITFDGANPGDFTVTTAPGLSTLSATTGTTTFVVTFKPLQSGPRSAVMHIASDDADENPFDITLTGTGTRFIGSNWAGSPIVTIPPNGSFTATGLNFDTDLGFVPVVGTPYTFIDIQGPAPAGIIGTFNDLPDGGVVAMSFGGVIYYFQVDYTAGAGGNDLVLTPFTPSGPPAWKHQAGPVARNAVAIFGTKGTGADANNPGARQGAMNWLDDDGDLWMLGGYGYAQSVTNPPRYLNDLWRYDRSAGQWIWVSGANVHNQFGNYTDAILANRTPGGRHTGTTWKDTDGDLWLFGGFGIGTTPGVGRLNDLWRFDTGTLLWTHMKGSNVTGSAGVYGPANDPANTPGARQGATGWATPGFLWLFGGTTDGGTTHHNDLWRYSIASGNWTVIKGNATTNVNGTYAGAPADNTPGARRDATGWVAKDNKLWLFGGSGLAATGTTLGDMSDLWSFDPVTGNWTHISGPITQGSTGTYTALNAAGTPAARSAGSGWVTVDGDLWLVGGFKNGKDCYNDVWIYDIGTSTWTWKLGSSSTNVGGSYGVGSDSPGARFTPSTWVTLNGTVWLFGGGGYDVFGNGGRMSDLWSYGIPNPVGAPWDEAQPEPFPAELIVNADPNTSDASAGTMAYVPVSGQLTGSDADGDKLLFSATGSTLSRGTLTLNTDGTWTYVPAAGFTGSTAFQFKASDNYGGESAVRTLVITVSTNLADSDGDGIADGYEYEQWGSLASADGEGDADLDGQSNYFEFLAGTDPLDANERLATSPSVAGSSSANGSIKLSLTHVRPGVNYHLETSTDLDVWTRLGTFTFSVAGAAEIEDPTPATSAPKFYRMNLEATPAVVLP